MMQKMLHASYFSFCILTLVSGDRVCSKMQKVVTRKYDSIGLLAGKLSTRVTPAPATHASGTTQNLNAKRHPASNTISTNPGTTAFPQSPKPSGRSRSNVNLNKNLLVVSVTLLPALLSQTRNTRKSINGIKLVT